MKFYGYVVHIKTFKNDAQGLLTYSQNSVGMTLNLRLVGKKILVLGIIRLVYSTWRLSSQWFKFGRHLKNKSP